MRKLFRNESGEVITFVFVAGCVLLTVTLAFSGDIYDMLASMGQNVSSWYYGPPQGQ